MISGPGENQHSGNRLKLYERESYRAYSNAKDILICERQSARVAAKLVGTSKQAGTEIEFGRRLEKALWPTVVDALGWTPCDLTGGGETGRKFICEEVAVVGYLGQGSWEEGCRRFVAIPGYRFGGVCEVTADSEKRDRYVDFVAISAVSQGMLTCAEHPCHVEAVRLTVMCRTDLVEV